MKLLPLLAFCALTSPLAAQSFAIFSPAAAQSLASQRDTPAAKAILRAADGDLKASPHPMARVHTEGTLPHQGIRDESIEAERDFDKMQNLAFAFRLTGDKQYLTKTADFLNAWVSIYKVSGNPIDETRWQPVLLAFDLTRADLPADLTPKTTEFFRAMSLYYCDWTDQHFAEDPYNWSSHRIKLAVLAAYSSGDATLIARSARAYTRQVKQNIRKDGSVNDFYKRDALHYVVYDLEPLTMAALAAKAHGQDWFHTAPPSVEQATDWLVPFATGAQTHQEFAHSSVAFDAARDKAGEKGYSGAWVRTTSVELFAQATWLDPKYAPTLKQLLQSPDAKLQPWIILAQAAK